MPNTAQAPISWRVPLPPVPVAASIARTLVRAALMRPAGHSTQTRQAPACAPAAVDHDVAELLTSELVTNAVEHTTARAPLELLLEVQNSGFRVEVRDHDAGPVEELMTDGIPHHGPDLRSEGGRGLLLVRELSSSAGCSLSEGGKGVWFTLSSGQAQY
ncbi:ATP-binding protein [Streptomyces sp. NPDC058284]|uniref:ATP-binding protein n=1 Tax=unclassified Streptomyces TaxID=2593676 RepID=UPI003648E78B